MSIGTELLTYLETQAVGVAGVSLFIGEIPDGELVGDDALSINVIGGDVDAYADFRHANGSFVYRCTAYETGQDKYDEIKAILHKNANCVSEFVGGGHEVVDIYVTDEPSYVGKDESQRYIFEWQLRIDYV